MNWKRYFNSLILDRGLLYYQKKKVKGIAFDGDQLRAKVLGTRLYEVAIDGLKKKQLKMSCNCLYAQSGGNCKHMAAVLYAWEAGKDKKKEEELREESTVRPFQKASGGRRYYFQMDKMTEGLVFTGSVAASAQMMIEQGQISLNDIQLGYDPYYRESDQQMHISAVWNDGRQRAGVSALLTKDKIREMNCGVCHRHDAVEYYRSGMVQPCSHETALLYLAGDYIEKYNPGDETDSKGSWMLGAFGNLRVQQNMEETARIADVSLEPRLSGDYDGYSLGFKIGAGKMYVLKNLSEFLKTWETLGTLELGKLTKIHFSTETMKEDSMPWLEFLLRRKRELGNINRQLGQQGGYYDQQNMRISSLGGSVPLIGSALDEFYQLAKGTAVPYLDKVREFSVPELHIREGHPDVSLTIRPVRSKQGDISSVVVEGELPDLLEGNEHRYFRSFDSLCLLEEEDHRMLAPLQQIARGGTVSFRVGMQNLPEFYYRILPQLRANPCFQITEVDMDDMEQWMPPEAVFSFFLDVDAAQGTILCKGKVTYDEKEHTLSPLKFQETPVQDWRDIRQEEKISDSVQEIFPEYDPVLQQYSCPKNEESVFRVLDTGIRMLMKLGEVSGTKDFYRLRIRKTPMIRFGVTVESNLLNLDISSSDLTREDLLELLESYRSHKLYHRLRSGEFIRLEQDDNLDMIAAVFESMNIPIREFVKGKIHIPLYRALYLNKMLEEHEAVSADRDRNFRTLVKNFKTVQESDYEVPSGLRETMRNYQVYGYKWLRTLADAGFGGILADDMGLGKTLQMIAVLLAAKEEGRTGTSLVVCPASLVYNWLEECRRFAPALTVRTVTGTAGERKAILKESEGTDLLITSYDLLRRDLDLYEEKQFEWQILDEAQYVKNPKAAISKSVRILHSCSRVALTGTPIENRLSELWSIFDYLMPGYLYPYETFRSQLETPITRSQDPERIERLRKMVSPFILRRQK